MTTATQAPRKPAKARPADTCRLSVSIRGTLYTARPIRPETSDVIRAWRLRKADGTVYTVADTIDGATCDCADFTYRHDGHDQTGCKHIRSCRALGLIDPDGEGDDAHGWPAWTDSHAFTVAHR
jgi:hypothetical protein